MIVRPGRLLGLSHGKKPKGRTVPRLYNLARRPTLLRPAQGSNRSLAIRWSTCLYNILVTQFQDVLAFGRDTQAIGKWESGIGHNLFPFSILINNVLKAT